MTIKKGNNYVGKRIKKNTQTYSYHVANKKLTT